MPAADPVLTGFLRGRITRLVRGSVADSLTRNSVSIMATSMVNAGLGYVYWTLAARLMPATEVGLGSAVTSAMVILSLATHLGAGAGLIARLPSRRGRADWLLTALSTQIACALATLVSTIAALVPLALLVAPLRVLTTNPALAAWFVLGALAWTSADLLDFTFIAQRRSGLMLCRNAIGSVVKLVALVLLLVLLGHGDATTIVATWSLSGILGTAAGFVLCHRRVMKLGAIPLRAIGGELRELIRPVLNHHVISVCSMVPSYLLPIVVTARLGTQDNAYFYTTWMVGSAIFMISPAVASAIFAEGSHDSGALGSLSRRSLRIILALVLPAVLVVGGGGKLILHVFGNGYAAAGYPLLVVLLISAFPDAVTNVAVAMLRVRRRLRNAAMLNTIMALISVVGAWFVVPPLGIIGAGIAWLGAQAVGAILVLLTHNRSRPVAEPAGTE